MRSISTLFLFLGVALAAPSPRAGHVLHEKRALEPVDWVQTRRLEPDRVLPLRIGLSQSNIDKLEDILMSMSHPKSPDYGKHWSAGDVVEYFAPSAATVEAVREWLTSFGFSEDRIKLSSNKGWMHVENATTSEIEDLLSTEYHVYTHPETGTEQISEWFRIFIWAVHWYSTAGCHSYHVPQHVKEHVDIIQPTVHFSHHPAGITRKHKRAAGAKPFIHSHLKEGKKLGKTLSSEVTITPSLENCDTMITPDCLRALYSVNYTPVATAQNTYGIGKFHPTW